MAQANPTTGQTGAQHVTGEELMALFKSAGDKPIMIDFFATWCGPCKLAGPVIDKLSLEYADQAMLVKLDVDENNDTARQFGVMSIPTVVVMKKDGDQMKEIDRKIGFPGEAGYRQMLDKATGATAKA